jgi:hypothetical protein
VTPLVGTAETVQSAREQVGAMGIRTVTAVVAVGTTSLVVALTGCGGSRQATPAQLAAIDAVLSSRQGAAMAELFSRRPGSVSCRISEGGPVTQEVAGRCETHVALADDGSAVVRFVETWDGRDFRGQGSPAAPGLHHAWWFTLSRSGTVRGPKSSGDFPPQWVK